MIIDNILDRQEFEDYNAKEFYMYCMQSSKHFDGIADEITAAMDYGTNEDVQDALCNYITGNGYSPEICTYINSVNWI